MKGFIRLLAILLFLGNTQAYGLENVPVEDIPIITIPEEIEIPQFSPKEQLYLLNVRAMKLIDLLANTDTELINIGQTFCGKTYYRSTALNIYMENNYEEDVMSSFVMSHYAAKYLCKTKISKKSKKVIWLDEIETTQPDFGQTLANAAKKRK